MKIEDRVLSLLSNYRLNKRKIDILTYEMGKSESSSDSYKRLDEQLKVLQANHDQLLFYLSCLDTMDQDILRMKYLEGISTKEIAAKLNVTTRTISNHHKKAVDHLSELYQYVSNNID